MNVHYRHTQVGCLMIVALGGTLVCLLAGFEIAGRPASMTISIVIVGLCLLLFPTLTAVVESERIRCFFGLGLIRRQIPLHDVMTASVVRNSWLCGWGMRMIGRGWLWNVSGFWAVELELRNGRRFRIGTDQPEQLRAAIAEALTSAAAH